MVLEATTRDLEAWDDNYLSHLRMMTMRRNLGRTLERLEDRRLLTVAAEVIDGDLAVTGTPDGNVEIVATGADTFDIWDNGELVVALTGVNDDIRVQIDSGDGATDDTVEMRLAGASVDRVFVDLGDGTNRLILADGATGGSVQFLGGEGDDSLEVYDGVVVGRSLMAFLGDGDNTVDIQGNIQRSLTIYASEGEDLIELGDSSEVGGRVAIRAGGGDNTTLIGGSVAGSLYYRGGGDSDLVDVLATAAIDGRSTLRLGRGDNDLGLNGMFESHVNVVAGEGDDTVSIGELATVNGRVRLRLGAGDDLAFHSGQVTAGVIVDDPSELIAQTGGMPNLPMSSLLAGIRPTV